MLLRYLRGQKEVRHLWIDAICLNQDDHVEKAQQIPLMGYIYGQSQQVHIWLGTDNSTITQLFAFFRAASQLRETNQQVISTRVASLMTKYFKDASIDETFSQGIFLPGAVEALDSITKFFDRHWFSRRWVIQEAYVARQAIVHCGKYSIPMGLVASAANKFQSMDISSYPIRMAANLHRLKSSNKLTLMELLWNFHEARCAEKKDRIAALAGLISEDLFHIDYDTPWDIVYKQAASLALRSKDNSIRLQVLLHLFEFGHLSQLKDVVCPSWVPDWTSCRTRKLPYHALARNVDNISDYHTTFGCSITATLALNNDILEVYPGPPTATSRSWQVFYATEIGMYPVNELDTDRVVKIMQRLFPFITSNSAFEVLEISSLIQLILDFRHSEARDQRLVSRPLEQFIIALTEKLPEWIHLDFFDSLRKLGSLLRDVCFFALEPSKPGVSACRAYGICLTQVHSKDIMVPLWHREEKATGRQSILGGWKKAIDVTTMLAHHRGLDREYNVLESKEVKEKLTKAEKKLSDEIRGLKEKLKVINQNATRQEQEREKVILLRNYFRSI
ncbi:hypothetical protein TruAng_004340 [Truncatella angustata]|nr:hypothetical protein TruAng_004340 [Truncatella angustata]